MKKVSINLQDSEYEALSEMAKQNSIMFSSMIRFILNRVISEGQSFNLTSNSNSSSKISEISK